VPDRINADPHDLAVLARQFLRALGQMHEYVPRSLTGRFDTGNGLPAR
jgi:hypothetical protein